ncbi:anti-sigma factor [Rhizobium sp. CG5]|uniref:anti-sigma factor n=1 Tax=Rhizobium sp. CG5 TaxID=2726076 RepID=UPI0020334960|nr:anti-sigma factor [Rhizobium sp. CG5]MCM2472859.1 anti-sigma factor [Rhizobium sp. CG5]
MSPSIPTARERADDYVLGLLDPADILAFEAELEEDAVLRSAVAESRDRFVELDLAGPPRPVSADLWSRIDAVLPEAASRGTSKAASPLANGPAAPAPAVNDNRLSRWRATAMAGIAASLLLLAGLSYSVLNQPAPQVIAVLVNEAGQPLVLVEDFGNDSARITPIADFNAPADRSLQVWTLPSKDMGPQSLGLLDGWRTALLKSAALPGPQEDQLYEITLEPPGGSPTGRPTGPILVKGFARMPR